MALVDNLCFFQLAQLASCFLVSVSYEWRTGVMERERGGVRASEHKPLYPSSATAAGTAVTAIVGHPNLNGGTDVEQSTGKQ